MGKAEAGEVVERIINQVKTNNNQDIDCSEFQLLT